MEFLFEFQIFIHLHCAKYLFETKLSAVSFVKCNLNKLSHTVYLLSYNGMSLSLKPPAKIKLSLQVLPAVLLRCSLFLCFKWMGYHYHYRLWQVIQNQVN